MKTIILDFTDGKVKILSHQADIDVEELLYEKGFSSGNIEWMTVDELEIESIF